jgi:hypothetical protein
LLKDGLRRSQVFRASALFDVHVFEFTRLEDLAAFLAFNKFSVFIAAYDLHARMLAGLLTGCVGGRYGRLGGHKSGSTVLRFNAEGTFAEFSGIVAVR